MAKTYKEIFKDRIFELFKDSSSTNANHANRLSALIKNDWFHLYDWLLETKNDDSRNKSLYESFEKAYNVSNMDNHGPRFLNDIKSALNALANYVWSIFDGAIMGGEYMSSIDLQKVPTSLDFIGQAVAGSAIFASKETIDAIQGKKDCIIIKDKVRVRNRNNTLPPTVTIDGKQYEVVGDDNTYANRYLKQAVLRDLGLPENAYSLFVNYMACHIWDSPTDYRYFLNLRNLALIPSFLAGFTDHNEYVQTIFRTYVYNVYGLMAPNGPLPQCPKNYSAIVWGNNVYHPNLD